MYISLEKILVISGIMLSVIGAWYISRCLIKKTNIEMIKEAGTTYSWNDNYVLSAIKQRIEGNHGITFIMFSALLQICFVIYSSETTSLIIFPVWSSITLILFLIMSLIVITNISVRNKYKKRVIEYISQNRNISEKTHEKDIERYISYIDKNYNYSNQTKEELVSHFNKIYSGKK